MDFGDPKLYASPDRFEMWEQHCKNQDVLWSPPGHGPGGFWSVFDHQSCTTVLRNDAPFTSEFGMLIGFDQTHPDRAGGKMVVATDGEKHVALRQIIGPYISRDAVKGIRDVVAKEIDAVMHVLREARSAPIDVAATVAPRLPAAVVCSLLDIPQDDREQLISLTDRAFASPSASHAADASQEAHTDIFFYFDDLVRRTDPDGDGLIAAMKRSDVLDQDDVLVNCYNLLIGGNQTTRHLIAAAFATAAAYPALLEAIRADATTSRLAVEELIRWASPGMHVLRVATEDIVINDVEIKKHQAVVAWVAAANRDERVFDNSGEFLFDRKPNRHVGFGYGAHQCLGANVARFEVAELLIQLAEHINEVEVSTTVPTVSNLIQGFQRLDIQAHWR